jgi:hypothetical protein
MPAVSYLEPAVYQDAHPAQSDPLDEQHFIVDTMNRLQTSNDWKDTAVVIAYDDSDGWYDHQMSPIVNNSQSPQDTLTGDGSFDALAGSLNRLFDYQHPHRSRCSSTRSPANRATSTADPSEHNGPPPPPGAGPPAVRRPTAPRPTSADAGQPMSQSPMRPLTPAGPSGLQPQVQSAARYAAASTCAGGTCWRSDVPGSKTSDMTIDDMTAGIDEPGMGSLAGPVCAAAVILPCGHGSRPPRRWPVR